MSLTAITYTQGVLREFGCEVRDVGKTVEVTLQHIPTQLVIERETKLRGHLQVRDRDTNERRAIHRSEEEEEKKKNIKAISMLKFVRLAKWLSQECFGHVLNSNESTADTHTVRDEVCCICSNPLCFEGCRHKGMTCLLGLASA